MKGFLELFKGEATFLLHNKKNLINILILGILILGLFLGIDLVRREQILRSQAKNEPVVFTGNNVTQKDGKWIAKKPQVTLKLTSSLGSAGTSPSPSPTISPPSPSPSSPAGSFLVGANIETAPSYGYQDLKPKSKSTDIDADLKEVQKMGGSLVRVFMGNNQISDSEAASRLGAFLDKAAQYNISVIPVFIDFYGGPWDHQSMVNAYTNAACPGASTDVDISGSTVILCSGTRTRTWAQLELELLWANYASGHNPQGTDQYYVWNNGFSVLNSDFFTEGYKQNYKNFVKVVIEAEKNHSNIFAWEVGNELKSDPQTFIDFMKDMTSMIKSLDPSHKVALGMLNAGHTGLTADQLYSSLPDVDIITVHPYNGDRNGTDDVKWAVAHGKIALIEEIGFGGNSDRSGRLRDEINYWKSIGASGVLPWGFIAKGLTDNGDGDSGVGFDAIFHSDYDQIFAVLQSF